MPANRLWSIPRWRPALFFLAVSVQVTALVRAYLRPGLPVLAIDSALFQHAGWYISQGAKPYIDIWDPKPPLVLESTAFLALLSADNMMILHFLSVLATSLAAIGSILIIGQLTFDVTGDGAASFISGLVPFTFPGFYLLPTLGFLPKHFTIFFGLLSLLLATQRRPIWAGLSAALSSGYWLLGAVFGLITIGLAWQREGPKGGLRVLSGMAIGTGLVLLPIILWGAFIPMVVETILVPLLVPENQSLIQRLLKFGQFLGAAIIPFLVGGIGALRLLAEQRRTSWWLSAGIVLYAIQLLWFDFDNFPDLLPILVFLAISVGCTINAWAGRWRLIFGLMILMIIGINPFLLRNIRASAISDAGSLNSTSIRNGTAAHSMQSLYWNRIVPASCHYRLSRMELDWMARMEIPPEIEECGIWPLGAGQRLIEDQPNP